LGDVHSSRDVNFHKYYKIDTVFNCSKDLSFISGEGLRQRHYRLPVHDNLQEKEIIAMGNMSFQAVTNLDKELKKGRRVLVHCYAGAQRSATLVTMYLIFKYNMKPEEAIYKVKRIRPQAFPRSINFKRAIEFFYETLSKFNGQDDEDEQEQELSA
jgi:protein-tyrosine phosphatase